jgi:hypothetical protein
MSCSILSSEQSLKDLDRTCDDKYLLLNTKREMLLCQYFLNYGQTKHGVTSTKVKKYPHSSRHVSEVHQVMSQKKRSMKTVDSFDCTPDTADKTKEYLDSDSDFEHLKFETSFEIEAK